MNKPQCSSLLVRSQTSNFASIDADLLFEARIETLICRIPPGEHRESSACVPVKKLRHVCKTCHRRFDFYNQMIEHCKPGVGENVFQCCNPGCHVSYRTQAGTRRHYRQCHELPEHVCDQCEKAFLYAFELKNHSAVKNE